MTLKISILNTFYPTQFTNMSHIPVKNTLQNLFKMQAFYINVCLIDSPLSPKVLISMVPSPVCPQAASVLPSASLISTQCPFTHFLSLQLGQPPCALPTLLKPSPIISDISQPRSAHFASSQPLACWTPLMMLASVTSPQQPLCPAILKLPFRLYHDFLSLTWTLCPSSTGY